MCACECHADFQAQHDLMGDAGCAGMQLLPCPLQLQTRITNAGNCHNPCLSCAADVGLPRLLLLNVSAGSKSQAGEQHHGAHRMSLFQASSRPQLQQQSFASAHSHMRNAQR